MNEFHKHPILTIFAAAWVIFGIYSAATRDSGDCYYFSQHATDC
ncbi:hypothetical protein [Rhodobacter sp. SY28-1]|nr:hypothetical protein [Rhodobacter sp. SY28-1]